MPPPSLEVLNDAIRREDDPVRLPPFLAAREAIYSVRRDVEPRGDLQPTQPSLTRSRSVPVRFQSCAWPAPCSLAPGLCPPARPGPSK